MERICFCWVVDIAGRLWEIAETKALLNLWAEEAIQWELKGAKRSKSIYEILPRRMEELGYYCTWSQYSVKIKNLVSKYRKVQDGNNTTGNNRQDFVFYDTLDSGLGTEPVTQPDTIISSSTV